MMQTEAESGNRNGKVMMMMPRAAVAPDDDLAPLSSFSFSFCSKKKTSKNTRAHMKLQKAGEREGR